jgi:hypothetical protein
VTARSRKVSPSSASGIPEPFIPRHPMMMGFFLHSAATGRFLLRHKLVEKAGFTLVEAFSVEGIGQPVEFIVQVVAELMQERA